VAEDWKNFFPERVKRDVEGYKTTGSNAVKTEGGRGQALT
jgi:hypothetical protein